MINLPFIVEPCYEMVWTKPFNWQFPGSHGGSVRSKIVIGAGMDKIPRHAHPSFFIVRCSSRPSLHVRGNPPQRGATPGARRGLCVGTGNRAAPARGPAAPRSPRRLRLGQGRESHASTPIRIFHREDAPLLPSLHVRVNRMQGSGGATPGQRRPSLLYRLFAPGE